MANPNTAAAFAELGSYLNQMGLGQLFSIDAQGNPGGWLWNRIQSGTDTMEELQVAIESTDVFRERFGVIIEQRRRAAAGDPGYVMRPQDVIDYERTVKQTMAAAGLPGWFYDQPEDFNALILNNMSASEVSERVSQGFEFVQSAPAEVRAAFNEFYGVGQGDAALAAWALDPDRVVRDINKATRTAYASGMARRFDVTISRQAAERIADLPRTEAGIVEGLTQVASQADVFDEGIGEATDLTTDTGVAAVFDGDAAATAAMSRRIGQRRSVNQASTGGAAISNTGVVGASSS